MYTRAATRATRSLNAHVRRGGGASAAVGIAYAVSRLRRYAAEKKRSADYVADNRGNPLDPTRPRKRAPPPSSSCPPALSKALGALVLDALRRREHGGARGRGRPRRGRGAAAARAIGAARSVSRARPRAFWGVLRPRRRSCCDCEQNSAEYACRSSRSRPRPRRAAPRARAPRRPSFLCLSVDTAPPERRRPPVRVSRARGRARAQPPCESRGRSRRLSIRARRSRLIVWAACSFRSALQPLAAPVTAR